MSGISTVDAAIDSAGLHGKLQRILFSKLLPSATVASSPYSLWKATGIPAAGTDPTLGVANGRTPTKTSAGAISWLNDAASGEITNFVGFGATSATATTTGTLILCDKTADVQLSHAEPTNTITGVDGTSRMASTTAPGDGGQLWMEVTVAFSAAANSISFTYTNQLGTGSQVTQAITTAASASINRSAICPTGSASLGQQGVWNGLATGDTGVRSVQSTTLISGSATGQYNLSIVRPIGYIPLTAVSQYQERDFVVEIPCCSKIYDNACLFFIFIPGGASTPTIFGELRALAK